MGVSNSRRTLTDRHNLLASTGSGVLPAPCAAFNSSEVSSCASRPVSRTVRAAGGSIRPVPGCNGGARAILSVVVSNMRAPDDLVLETLERFYRAGPDLN
jgi:hypothetical protein